MTLQEIADKYGKTLAKQIGTIAFSGKLNELLDELHSLNYEPDITQDRFICVAFPEEASILATRFGKLNIIVLGDLVQPHKGITLDHLNISIFEQLAPGSTVVLAFNDSIESEITKNALEERYPNINFTVITYGVSAVKPVSGTDEYTQYKVFKNHGLIGKDNASAK